MPVPPSFYIVSARVSELLGYYKYEETRALIHTMLPKESELIDYFLARVADHEKYLGPFAPRKKSPAQ